MKYVRHLLTLILATFLYGCSTSGIIKGFVHKDQKIVKKNESEYILSSKKYSVVISNKHQIITSAQRMEFFIAINNHSSSNLPFKISDLHAFYITKENRQLKNLKIISQNELIDEQADYLSSLKLSNSLYALTNAITAYKYAKIDPNLPVPEITPRYNYVEEEEKINNNIQAIADNYLKSKVIPPRETHQGSIVIRLPELTDTPAMTIIIVKLRHEKHIFTFEQRKLSN